jgi:transcriptional regulator with XRE-family HTH domain
VDSIEPVRARVIPFNAAAMAAQRTATAPALSGTDAKAQIREPLWRNVVGDVLRRERLAQERTLKDVADAARISMPYLSELERGRKEASSEVLAAAARALGLGLADLLALAQNELARLTQARIVRVRSAASPHSAGRGSHQDQTSATKYDADSATISDPAAASGTAPDADCVPAEDMPEGVMQAVSEVQVQSSWSTGFTPMPGMNVHRTLMSLAA